MYAFKRRLKEGSGNGLPEREKVGGGTGEWPEEKVLIISKNWLGSRQQLSCHIGRSCMGCLQESCDVTKDAGRAKSKSQDFDGG